MPNLEIFSVEGEIAQEDQFKFEVTKAYDCQCNSFTCQECFENGTADHWNDDELGL